MCRYMYVYVVQMTVEILFLVLNLEYILRRSHSRICKIWRRIKKIVESWKVALPNRLLRKAHSIITVFDTVDFNGICLVKGLYF